MFPIFTLLTVLVLTSVVASRTDVIGQRDLYPVPLSIPATQYWDGDDGLWSTFSLEIGSPPQQLRLLPSTNQNAIWVVLSQGCTSQDPSDCATLRGFEYAPNASSTFERIGTYFELQYGAAQGLGYSGNAEVGYDNVTLGWPGDGLPTLEHQIVEGFAAQFPFVGVLGLNPRAINLTSLNNRSETLLGSLRSEGFIPSTSWAYTAGSRISDPPVFGSLTLGGYDTTRFIPNEVTMSFGEDTSRDLLVAVQSIQSISTKTELLPTGVYALIDSLIPTMWLPLAACQTFERALNLTWNDTAQMYLLDNTTRGAFLAQNLTFSFVLSSSLSSSETVEIVVPYEDFDLEAVPPLIGSPTWYFPLQRAENESQYTLGRAFLRRAYVIADYDRSNFSVSQALFPSTSISQNLVAIHPPETARHSRMSAGTLAGIVVGVSAGLIIISVSGFYVYWRRRQRRGGKQESLPATSAEEYSKPILDGTQLVEKDAAAVPTELPSLTGTGMRHEMEGSNLHAAEMPGQVVHEIGMKDLPVQRLELPSSLDVHALYSELPAGGIEDDTGRRPLR